MKVFHFKPVFVVATYLCGLLMLGMPVSAIAGEMRIASTWWPPYIIENENEIKGIAVDVVRELFEMSEEDYLIELLPWKRGYQNALSSTNYGIFPLAKTKDREDLFDWIGPIISSGDLYLFSLSSSNIFLQNLNESFRYSIAVRRGGIEQQRLLSMGLTEEENYFTVVNQEQAIKMLLAGRVDFIIESEISLNELAKKAGVKFGLFKKGLKLIDLSDELYLGLNKGQSVSFLEKLQTNIEQLEKDGFIDRVTNKYLNQD